MTGAAGSVGAKLVEKLTRLDDVDGIVALDCLPVSASHPRVVVFQKDIRNPLRTFCASTASMRLSTWPFCYGPATTVRWCAG